MSFVDWKNEAETEEYLKNIAAEYSFACYKEKDPEGCRLLGEYEYTVRANYERAARIFEQACDTYSEPESCNKLAYMKAVGKGTAQDLKGATLLAKKACDKKAKTCLTAAMFAANSKDWPLTSRYLDRACSEGGVPAACTRLADIKLKGQVESVTPKTGVEVIALLDRACELGDAPGCVNAAALLGGKAKKLSVPAGIAEDATQAARYRERAKKLSIPSRGGSATT